jgi:hypothetical protein
MKKNIILKSLALVMISSMSENINAGPNTKMPNSPVNSSLSAPVSQQDKLTGFDLIEKVKKEWKNASATFDKSKEKILNTAVRRDISEALSKAASNLKLLEDWYKDPNGNMPQNYLETKLVELSRHIEMSVTQIQMNVTKKN